jgi:hypothetical protein
MVLETANRNAAFASDRPGPHPEGSPGHVLDFICVRSFSVWKQVVVRGAFQTDLFIGRRFVFDLK